MKKGKRILSSAVTLCLVLGLLLVPSSVAYASTVETVSIDAPATVDEGVTFTARVNTTDVTDFDAGNYDIVFDPAVLTFVNATDGDIGGTTIPIGATNEIEAGRIRVVNNVSGTPGVTGSGYLAELHFTVIGASGTSSNITLGNGCLGDNTATEITVTNWTGDLVTVAALVADFTVDTTEGYVEGDDVTTFTFTDSTAGGTPSSSYAVYSWSFGDDTQDSSLESPTHTYASAGDYTVSLTVTDTWSGTDIAAKTDHITVYNTLVAGFSADNTEAVKGSALLHPPTITFTDATAGGKTVYTYSWTFGDAQTSAGASPSNTYAPAGTLYGQQYAVTLTVNDNLTAMAVEEKTTYITIYQMGDINEDLTVNGIDITEIELIVAGGAAHPETLTANANEDTNINSIDVTKTELLVAVALD